jgi:hypothetical protein
MLLPCNDNYTIEQQQIRSCARKTLRQYLKSKTAASRGVPLTPIWEISRKLFFSQPADSDSRSA